jgi:multidrug efflux pump subunit AcrA (membrane-fusion protein)/YHS domain-containing protein
MATVYNYQFLTRQQQYVYALEFEERRRAKDQASNQQSPEAQSIRDQARLQQSGPQQSMPTGTFSTVSATPGGEMNMSGRAVYSIRDQVEVARLELYSLGVGDHQIAEIARTKRLASDIEIRSPVTGLVLNRNVSPQQRIDRGLELFRIADLTRVWIIADVYGSEERYIKPGMSAKVSLPDEKTVFKAVVTDVPPPFDTASRTLKVRLETDNTGFILRPEMFVDVEFLINLPPAITVPADAVLDSGLKKIVFMDLGNGCFKPQGVETGWRFGNRVEIVKGLKAGDQIVTSGTFLIDSESRLELAAAGMVETLSKDPVCGEDVSVNKAVKAGRKSVYQGKSYYFTSDECKARFDRDPGNWRSN